MRNLLLAPLVVFAITFQAAPPSTSAPFRVEKDGKLNSVPVLTTEEKQQLQIIAQRLQIADLQSRIAQSDLAQLLKSLEKEGWTLDLQRLEYLKKPEEKK